VKKYRKRKGPVSRKRNLYNRTSTERGKTGRKNDAMRTRHGPSKKQTRCHREFDKKGRAGEKKEAPTKIKEENTTEV